ncbi:hypothetical protein LQE92_07600 [Lacrimispora sp. NSJ-141]|uniref:Uncharacterized protein n=1 Tax=Lientehia hominis TaxID=2897778 RepID=A0AAP2RKC6_9FIRM|nr:hypothetical protein [Lientehia hominis]MCD2492495.1 hypothetical protein [Lientehia hominis]
MLDTQINLYSVDTGNFYSNAEAYLHRMNCRYRQERNSAADKLSRYEELLFKNGYDSEDLKNLRAGNISKMKLLSSTSHLLYEYLNWNCRIAHKRKKAKESKEKLLLLLSNKVLQNERTQGRDHIRSIREGSLNDGNVISLFDSSLTRMMGIKMGELTEDIMVVQVYYFSIFKDISYFGFLHRDEKYRYYTSSAGQIRRKKAVFIKESAWNRYEKTIMCGLTIDKINLKGGNNVNKHLAYMALSNSATDRWEDFDIDKTIVIDDFETPVSGILDFIDDETYSITRRNDTVNITHTDGAGMMLPSVLDRNVMFRAPWIKGLLCVFDYRSFIEEKKYSPIVRDIYGQEHNLISEDIRIIFTRSQFKMHRYYSSWEEYIGFYKKYGCTAGLCNPEEKYIKDAKINYQMLQTLTDISPDEVRLLAAKSVDKLNHMCSSIESLMKIFGVTSYNSRMTSLQNAVKLYPALIGDPYMKTIVRGMKDRMVREYRSGRLEIDGKYTFILPDLYAACEHWFGHVDQPAGLLDDGEVYCRLYPKAEKLDCLRSPHLYKEHAIRYNAAVRAPSSKKQLLKKWFATDGLYTSSRDLISRLLQFDVDGDKALVAADKYLISVAERNMKGVVPLYYNMKKSAPCLLSQESIYQGLNAAFTGGNIGIYSNNIAKVWNHEVFLSGTEQEKQDAVDTVKLLCMENNFVIDYAKTLYKPKRPDEKNHLIKTYTQAKLPAFFLYAKDKTEDQVAACNGSLVNQLRNLIPNPRLNFRKAGIPKLDYRRLMADPETEIDSNVTALYTKLNQQYHFKINMQDEYIHNLEYLARDMRNRLSSFGHTNQELSDMLVKYLYGRESKSKEALWFCYGSYILENLKRNQNPGSTKLIQCMDCGEWFEAGIHSKSCRCESCRKEYRKAWDRERKKKRT